MEIPVDKIGRRRADLAKIRVVVPASDVSDHKAFLFHHTAKDLLGHAASQAFQDGVEPPVAVAAIHSRKGLPDLLPQVLIFIRSVQHLFLVKVTAFGQMQAVQKCFR